MLEMVRLEVLAVAKNPVPEAERLVVEALANCEVLDAKSPVRNQLGVVVEFVVDAKLVAIVQSQGLVRVTVPPSCTEPPPVRPAPAVTVRAPALVR